DYSDPELVCGNGDYFLTAASFTNMPGLPVLHSRDLVNWEIVNYAVERLEPAEYYNEAHHGDGVWAPSIRYHDGTYYIYWGDPNFGVYMVKTRDPFGKWDAPVLVQEGKGIIDTCPLWDDDGKAYLVNGWAKSRGGFNAALTVTEMSPDGTRLIGEPVMVYDGLKEGNHTIEGPKFYKRNGYYYIFAPAGSVSAGWQVVLRSRTPYGPYESRTVMAQGETDINGPHQGGWVETPEGEDWFMHFQDKGVIGRVVHLNPMKWVEDWPVIGEDKDGDGCGEPVLTYRKPRASAKVKIHTPVESDEFSSLALGKQWQWFANYQLPFGFATPDGYYRLYGHAMSENFVNMREIPNILSQKFPNEAFTATAKVTVSATQDGQQSGLIIMGRGYARLSVEKAGDQFKISLVECAKADKNKPETSTEVISLPPTRINGEGGRATMDLDMYMRVKVDKNELCTFYYSLDGKKWTACGKPFQAREGHWIGARVGFFSVMPAGKNRGWIDLDWFRITK
ncbi:MAG: glycoside hydrolase 43 family protein, partial [Muribaculaceae bacterium]|nr:glycoside hydrolase 43 family protein [Muribaculaceae bacterium]